MTMHAMMGLVNDLREVQVPVLAVMLLGFAPFPSIKGTDQP